MVRVGWPFRIVRSANGGEKNVNWLVAWLAPALLLALGRLVGFGPAGAPWANPCSWLVILLLLVVSATDLANRRIPNWATYTAMAWGLLAQGVLAFSGQNPQTHRFGFPPLAEALLGFLIGFLVFLVLYAVMGGGAGDVKLAGALGLFLGPAALGEVLFNTILLAGLVGGLWVFKKILVPTPETSLDWRGRAREALRGKLPMAPLFLAGLLIHWTPAFNGWLGLQSR